MKENLTPYLLKPMRKCQTNSDTPCRRLRQRPCMEACDLSTSDHAYEPRRLLIPRLLHKHIFDMIHTQDGHPGFQRCMDRLQPASYLKRAGKYLQDYIAHCPECLVFRTRRHTVSLIARYNQSSRPRSRLASPKSTEGFGCLLSVTDKLSKQITLISGQATYTAEQWAKRLTYST